MTAHMRTKRSRRQVPQHSKLVVEPVVPAGWTVEEDRREEFLALSYLVAIGKVA